MVLPTLLASVLCIAMAVSAIALYQRRPKFPLPPSIPHASPKEHLCQVYAKRAQVLGPIFMVQTTIRPIMVLNTVAAISDLLENRSNFWSRPRWPMAELIGRQKNVGFQYYGNRLRLTRKALNRELHVTVLSKIWAELLHDQSDKLVRRFLHSPNTFYEDVHHNVEATLVRFTYGHEPDAEFAELTKRLMRHTNEAVQPGKWAVDRWPILMYVPSWMPGAGFKRWAKDAKNLFDQSLHTAFYRVKDEVSQDLANPSFVRHALEASEDTAAEDDIIMSAACSLMNAGTESVVGVILTVLLLLVRRPEIQRRAYAELESVVGLDRLPDLRDKEHLIYIDCLIKEAHRFNPMVPLIPRSNMNEDEYIGYGIPKDTWVMVNIWSVLHDEKEYAEPEKYIPERFMPKDGYTLPRDPLSVVYGFVRRNCPGNHLANNIIFLAIARTITCFELLPAMQQGPEQLPPLDFATGLIASPKPFHCVFKPRKNTKGLLGEY